MTSAYDGESDDRICRDGGAEGDRTPDLRNAIATLSQLSYGPAPFVPPSKKGVDDEATGWVPAAMRAAP